MLAFGAVPISLSKGQGYVALIQDNASTITWPLTLNFYPHGTDNNQKCKFMFQYYLKAGTSKTKPATATFSFDIYKPDGTVLSKGKTFAKITGTGKWSSVTFPDTFLLPANASPYSLILKSSGTDTAFIDYLTVNIISHGDGRKYEAEYASFSSKCKVKNSISGYSSGMQGDFATNITSASDYTKYRTYIKKFFGELIRRAGSRDKVRSWDFVFFEEPNHTGWFDGAHKCTEPYYSYGYTTLYQSDPSNLAEYEKLYDYALAGMRDTGIDNNLGLGCSCCDYANWLKPLIQFLSGTNIANGKTRLNTLRDSVSLQIDVYWNNGDSPRDFLRDQADSIQSLETYLPSSMKMLISCGESGTGSDTALGGISNDGAACFASQFKGALDYGYENCTNWFLKTWGDEMKNPSKASDFANGLWNGHKTAAYRTIDFLSIMNGTNRLNINKVTNAPLNSSDEVDIIASKAPCTSNVMAFIYNYTKNKTTTINEPINIAFKNLQSNCKYILRKSIINKNSNNFFEEWMSIVGNRNTYINSVPNYDLLGEPLAPANLTSKYDSLWQVYRDTLHYESSNDISQVTSTQDSIVLNLNLEPNSVYFLQLIPLKNAINGSLYPLLIH